MKPPEDAEPTTTLGPASTPPPNATSPGNLRSLGRKLVVVMLAGVVLYGALVVIRGTDKIEAELAHFQPSAFAAACGLASLNYFLRFARWEYYLGVLGIHGDKRALGWGESFLVFLSGFVFTVTPGKVGEVFKSVVLHELRGIDVVRTAPIVVAERLTDVVGVVLLIAFGSTALPGGILWACLGTVAVAALLVFVTYPAVSSPVLGALGRLPGRAGALARSAIPKIETMLLELKILATPRRLVWPATLAVVGWSLEGVGVWLIVRGFGVAAELPPVAFSYSTATLAGALVPLPIGVVEKVLEETMVAVAHVPGPIATATMLMARLATLWFAVAVGFIALGLLRARNPGLLAEKPPIATEQDA